MRNPFNKRRAGIPLYRIPYGEDERVEVHDKRLQKLEETLGEMKPFDRGEHMDKSRAKIALLFVRWYFGLILLILLGVPIYNLIIGSKTGLELSSTIAQIGTLLGSPLGFVVGYYFKEQNTRR